MNTSDPNQPPSYEVKDLVSKKPIDPTSNFYERYSRHIPSQSTPKPTYTSSLENIDPHLDSSLNEELRGVTLKETLYRIPNKKFNQLYRHTQAYLKFIN